MIGGAPEPPLSVAAGLRALLGAGVEAEPAARRALAVGGVVPEMIARPGDQKELRACVECVAACGGALVPLGLGAHLPLGYPPLRYDVALSTARLAQVVEYAPADMTVTVEAGVTIAALQETLAAEGQWLPLDPPLPQATTVGGMVAADLGGPLRASQGRVRDFLIGISVVTAEGSAARAGGRVVKNVAGYDLMKLFAGSLGTLAVLTQATFKVRPRPAATRCLALACQALPGGLTLAERLAEADIAALCATLAWDMGGAGSPLLVCLLGGVDAEIAAERGRLLALAAESGAEVVLDAAAEEPAASLLVSERRDFVRAAPGNLVVRATAPPRHAGRLAAAVSAAFVGVRGRCLLDPRLGALTAALEVADCGAAVGVIMELARAERGVRLVFERWPTAAAAGIEVWWPLPAALPLMRRMKRTLDAGGVLAPGRFVGRI